MADDQIYGGDGALGIPHQRIHKARLEGRFLLRNGRGCRTDARDAADDCLGLSLEGGNSYEPKKGHCQTVETRFKISAQWTSCAPTRQAP